MIRNLTKETKTIRLKPDNSTYTVAAGTSTPLNSEPVDTAGWDGVRFIVGFGAIVSGGVQSVKVQQGAVANMSDGADLLGTGITVADTDDNKMVISEIIRPEERYLRTVIARATQNSTIDFLIAELFRTRDEPVTQDTTVASAELAVTPPEGTA